MVRPSPEGRTAVCVTDGPQGQLRIRPSLLNWNRQRCLQFEFTEKWLSGRKRSPAKGVWVLKPIEGSNPSFSASNKKGLPMGPFFINGAKGVRCEPLFPLTLKHQTLTSPDHTAKLRHRSL